nr:hypothetical protein [Maliibacterium massiliense]
MYTSLQDLINMPLEQARQALLEAGETAVRVVRTAPPRDDYPGQQRVVRALRTADGVMLTCACFLPAKQ